MYCSSRQTTANDMYLMYSMLAHTTIANMKQISGIVPVLSKRIPFGTFQVHLHSQYKTNSHSCCMQHLYLQHKYRPGRHPVNNKDCNYRILQGNTNLLHHRCFHYQCSDQCLDKAHGKIHHAIQQNIRMSHPLAGFQNKMRLTVGRHTRWHTLRLC